MRYQITCGPCVAARLPQPTVTEKPPMVLLCDEGWAGWTATETGTRHWVCPKCWTTRTYFELELLLGPTHHVWTGGEELIAPGESVHAANTEGRTFFRTREEFVTAVDTRLTRQDTGRQDTDAVQGMSADRSTVPYGAAVHLSTGDVARAVPNVQIDGEAGRGSTGIVYRGRRGDVAVAVKVLDQRLMFTKSQRERFRREAEALRLLVHKNIVRLIEHVEVTGTQVLVMELVEGITLRDLMSARTLEPARAIEIVEDVCSALALAHRSGIVHRDVKPENVFVDRGGQVKLGDFGIAKFSKEVHGLPTLTKRGAQLGTPEYMAPEQRRSSDAVDHRADIYAVGVMLYEMLTRKHPRSPNDDGPVVLDPVDPTIDALLAQATAFDPDERYDSIEDFDRALLSVRLGAYGVKRG